jgi:methylase of polypeptide subunit release factors
VAARARDDHIEGVLSADRALVDLGSRLRERGYRFVTPTPETHRRVNARPENAEARSLRDVFGWSRPFREGLLPPDLAALLDAAGAVEPLPGGALRSAVRFSSLGALLLAHSAHPTLAEDAVFLGPDTYRFAALLRREVSGARRAVDVGCGSGAGGLCLADRVDALVLSDVSPRALRFAAVNAALAGVAAEIVQSDVLAAVAGPFDLVVANPPYLVDERRRTYRDGGGPRGVALSARIAGEALARLAPGGRLVLYTATPVVEGRHALEAELAPVLAAAEAVAYEELDPDVFGEELERPPYADVERIAVVALTCRRPA